jgi:hypothetical protein
MISKALPVPKKTTKHRRRLLSKESGELYIRRLLSGTTNRPLNTGGRVYHIKKDVVKNSFVRENKAHERQISCFQDAALTNAEGLHGCRKSWRPRKKKGLRNDKHQASARQRLADPSGQGAQHHYYLYLNRRQ